jgi:hypothetical protein
MKCVTSDLGFERLDCAVVYVPKRFANFALTLSRRFQESLGPHLQSETPLFAKPVWPGVSIAEDPGTGESFGSHRCRLLAEAVWAAYASGLQTSAARLAELRTAFARNGLDLAQPHLSTSSRDWYSANGGR